MQLPLLLCVETFEAIWVWTDVPSDKPGFLCNWEARGVIGILGHVGIKGCERGFFCVLDKIVRPKIKYGSHAFNINYV